MTRLQHHEYAHGKPFYLLKVVVHAFRITLDELFEICGLGDDGSSFDSVVRSCLGERDWKYWTGLWSKMGQESHGLSYL